MLTAMKIAFLWSLVGFIVSLNKPGNKKDELGNAIKWIALGPIGLFLKKV